MRLIISSAVLARQVGLLQSPESIPRSPPHMGMQLLTAAAQQCAVGGVLHKRVLKQIGGVGRYPLPADYRSDLRRLLRRAKTVKAGDK